MKREYVQRTNYSDKLKTFLKGDNIQVDSHIFISYKSEDREDKARYMQSTLKNLGFVTWLDVDNPELSTDNTVWSWVIDNAIKTSMAMVVVLTRKALASRFVTNEWDIAIREEIPLFFCEFENIGLPQKYEKIPRIDFMSLQKPSLDKLTEILKNITPTQFNKTSEHIYLYSCHQNYGKLIGERTIETRATYGTKDQRSADPILLKASVDQVSRYISIDETHNSNSEELFAILDRVSDNILIVGEAGSGKTISLLHFFRDATIAYFAKVSTLIPILVNVADYDTELSLSIESWLKQLASSQQFKEYEILKNLDIGNILENGSALLILDGLDELKFKSKNDANLVMESSENHYQKLINHLSMLPAGNRIVCSCRINRIPDLDFSVLFSKIIRLSPLTDEQVDEYLYGAFPHLKDLIKKDSSLDKLLRNPFLLSIFAFTYQNWKDELDFGKREKLQNLQEHTNIRDEIIKNYVTLRYQHEISKSDQSLEFSLQEVYEILGHAAIVDIGDDRTFKIYNLLQNQDYNLLSSEKVSSFANFASELHLIEIEEYNLGEENIEDEEPVEYDWLVSAIFGEDSSSNLKYHSSLVMRQFAHSLIRDYFAFNYAKDHLREVNLYKLKDRDSSNPARALAKIRDPRSLPLLLDYFENLLKLPPSPMVLFFLEMLANAIAILESKEAFLPLTKGDQLNVHYDVHVAIMDAIYRTNHPEVLEYMVQSFSREFYAQTSVYEEEQPVFPFSKPVGKKLVPMPSHAQAIMSSWKFEKEKEIKYKPWLRLRYENALENHELAIVEALSFVFLFWSDAEYLWTVLDKFLLTSSQDDESNQTIVITIAKAIGLGIGDSSDKNINKFLELLYVRHKDFIQTQNILANKAMSIIFSLTLNVDHLLDCISLLQWQPSGKEQEKIFHIGKDLGEAIVSISEKKNIINQIELRLLTQDELLYLFLIGVLGQIQSEDSIDLLFRQLEIQDKFHNKMGPPIFDTIASFELTFLFYHLMKMLVQANQKRISLAKNILEFIVTKGNPIQILGLLYISLENFPEDIGDKIFYSLKEIVKIAHTRFEMFLDKTSPEEYARIKVYMMHNFGIDIDA